MAYLPAYILHGVKFQLSDVFNTSTKSTGLLPPEFDLKDPEVLLEELEYDFSLEKSLIPHSSDDHHVSEMEQSKWNNQSEYDSDSYQDQLPSSQEMVASKLKYSQSNSKESIRELEEVLTNIKIEKRLKESYKPQPRPRKFANLQERNLTETERGISSRKQNVLDQLTDILNDDAHYTEEI